MSEIGERVRLLAANADRIRAEGAPGNAAEMLWGALVTVLVGAVPRSRDERSSSHGGTRHLAHALAVDLREPWIKDAFSDAETVHANFHHDFLDDERLARQVESTTRLMSRLLELLPTASVGDSP